MEFVPKILGFLCNWCSYAGADNAGVSRIQYLPSVRVIRVMCSGRVDPVFVLEALIRGIDGVIILGCHPGDCHYISGNYEAEMKFDTVKQLLGLIGLDNRVKLDWVSAAEGARFAELINEFTENIKNLGKSPLRSDTTNSELKLELEAMINAIKGSRLRALAGRKRKIINEGNVYGKKIPPEKFNDIQKTAIYDEYIRQKILLLLKNRSMSVRELAIELKIDPSEVLENIVELQSSGLVALDRIENIVPYYISMMVDK